MAVSAQKYRQKTPLCTVSYLRQYIYFDLIRTCRAWCITVHNFTKDADYFTLLPRGVEYMIWTHERGGHEHRDHLHFYIRYRNSVRMSQVKALLGDETAHCERRQGTEKQAVDYVKKEGDYKEEVPTRVAGPWELGQPHEAGKEQGERTDLKAIAAWVKEGKSDYEIQQLDPVGYMKYHRGIDALRCAQLKPVSIFREVQVIVITGDTNSGKTWWFWHLLEKSGKLRDAYCSAETKNLQWWDGYRGQPVLLIDEFDPANCGIKRLLRILDKYPLTLERKGGMVYPAWELVWITAQHPVSTWYKDLDPLTAGALYRRITNEINIPPGLTLEARRQYLTDELKKIGITDGETAATEASDTTPTSGSQQAPINIDN